VRIVASSSRFITDELSGRAFRMAGVEVTSADDESLLEEVRRHLPALVILAEAPRLDGIALCERLKSDAELRIARVILALDRSPEELQLQRLAASGCDDVVLTRIGGESLYPSAARLCGLPDLSLATPVEVRDPGWSAPSVPRKAWAANLSARSVDLLCERPLSTGARLQLALRRDANDAPLEIEGTLARSEGGGGQPFRARILFADMSSAARLRLNDLCLWDARTLKDGTLRVDIRGAFDQASEFALLGERINAEGAQGPKLCLFDLSRVRQITSWGARAWILFLRGLPDSISYRFVNGSTLFSRHCGMIADMLGRGEVITMALPYECEACGAERARVVHVSWLTPKVRQEPPGFRCSSCGTTERFAELPDRYFSFLKS
jgi:CheY-like chemotaxis protein